MRVCPEEHQDGQSVVAGGLAVPDPVQQQEKDAEKQKREYLGPVRGIYLKERRDEDQEEPQVQRMVAVSPFGHDIEEGAEDQKTQNNDAGHIRCAPGNA